MEPVILGKKRAFLIKPGENNKHKEIIHQLRKCQYVLKWEKENIKWSNDIFQNMKETPYMIRPVFHKIDKCGNSKDCIEYFFFLTTLHSKKNCYFIEKKKPLEKSFIYQIRARFENKLFNNTLFSGTFVMSEESAKSPREEITYYFSEIFNTIKREISAPMAYNNWLFIINDIFNINGEYITYSLPQRLLEIQNIINNHWYPDLNLDVCDFELVTYYNYNTIEDFLRNKRKFFPYKICDSKVVFVNSYKISNEFCVSLIDKIPKEINNTIYFKNGKWDTKNIEDNKNILIKNNQELYLQKTEYPDVYWVLRIDTLEKLGAARIKSIEDSIKIKKILTKKDENIKFLCEWNYDFNKWQPIL